MVEPFVSEFTIVGRLENLVANAKGRIKYLYLAAPKQEYLIEMVKSTKNVFIGDIQPGCYLKVGGMRKYHPHRDEVSYKAYRIELLAKSTSSEIPDTITKSKAKILVCQGKSCGSQGGKSVCQLLQAELTAQDIVDQVEIKTTGCIKQCKQAPNIIMPGRNICSRVQPKQISQLVSKHLL